MTERAAPPVTFLQLAAPVRGRVILAGTLTALGALASVLPAIWSLTLARALVPALGGDPSAGAAALPAIAGLVGSVVLAQALSMTGYWISHLADARFSEYLRQRQITQALRLRLDWFAREGSGRIAKAVQDDVAKVHQLIAHVIPDTANGLVRPLASLVVLFALDWRIGLVGLIPLVCAAACMPLMLRDLTQRFAGYNHALGELSSAIVEVVRGISPIKMFEVSAQGPRRFQRAAAAHHRAYREWMEQTVFGSALILVTTSPAFAILVSASSTTLLIVTAGLDPALILPSVLLAANIAGPLFMLAQMRQFMREGRGAAQNIAEFFALPVAPAQDPAALTHGTQIDIDAVSFAYGDGPRVLRDVTGALAPGTVTALVGASGSGKSTLAALIPRLLDPDTGTIRLGGVDTQRLATAQLTSAVGFVFQDPYLLRMSVRDNIRLARPDAAEDAVVAAARAAQIHERVLQLPRGYDTIVGDEARLSGGERQRLSIARAILLDAPVLVLDEATAFADPDSEAAIQHALAELTRGRTILVVAHRLHTIVDADQILVLDGGGVIERGSHPELVTADGRYARMWRGYCAARDEPSAP